MLADNVIKSSDKIKYLELHLEQSLAGDHTVNSIIGKCASNLDLCIVTARPHMKDLRNFWLQFSFNVISITQLMWYMGATTKLKTRL